MSYALWFVSSHQAAPNVFLTFTRGLLGGLAGAQVTYDSTLNVWACCSYNGGEANCSNPTSEIFPAPAPSDLKSIVSLPRSGSATYSIPSATATSLSQSANSSNNSNSPSSSTQISAGAAAGIGVGTAAGVILLAAAAAILFWKRRGKREFSETKAQPGTGDTSDQQYMLRELEYKPVVRELGDDRMCHELDPAHQSGSYYPVKP